MINKLCYFMILFIVVCSFQFNHTFFIRGGNKMDITSSAFKDGAMIPEKYTCDGPNISPPLKWSNAPEETKTFAIICEDPDAPSGIWVHWILFNLPESVKELGENLPAIGKLPVGAKQGKNDFGKIGYRGPCPPRGIHRYFFQVYALTKELDLEPGISKSELIRAMEGNILSEGQMMGKYQR